MGYQHCVMGGGIKWGSHGKEERSREKFAHPIYSPIRSPNLSVPEHFLYIKKILGRAIAGLSYGRFIAIRYKFRLPTYIQEPLVIGGVTYREI